MLPPPRHSTAPRLETNVRRWPGPSSKMRGSTTLVLHEPPWTRRPAGAWIDPRRLRIRKIRSFERHGGPASRQLRLALRGGSDHPAGDALLRHAQLHGAARARLQGGEVHADAADGAGARPASVSFAKRKRSMAFAASASNRLRGGAGRPIGTNDQGVFSGRSAPAPDATSQPARTRMLVGIILISDQ